MVILRPSYRSKMLASLEQLRETITTDFPTPKGTAIEMTSAKGKGQQDNVAGYNPYENYDSNRDSHMGGSSATAGDIHKNQLQIENIMEETKEIHEDEEEEEEEDV
eukprot:CAMPEP_0202963498 /NCGR_PEP_ID=MMETSP1396-20130829/7491_1 /ASSEMBLY_ACC=CAM_ASM_000872 /TAXON_ID= /ORGANISM="Pseudokeronopsis sp., Strain Brazil" /LENGTH=105 /DNA_ID=CAMNT_0049684765 /DNA_START=1269 /DNA_END=1586 /DNA_ORIENTATION=-